MYPRHFTLICLAALPLMALTCDRNKETPGPVSTSSMEEFMIKHRSPKQVFTVNAQSAIHVVGSQGITVDIAPNTITTQSGAPVNGIVQLQLIEVFTKKDQIFHDKLTTTYNQMLVSQGEFFLSISQNGNNLTSPATVSVPAVESDPDPTLLFLNPNVQQVGDSLPTGWILPMQLGITNVPANAANTFNNSSYAYQIQMQITGVYWLNCDVFYSNQSASKLSGVTWNSPVNDLPKGFLVIDGFNSTGYLTPSATGLSFSSGNYTVPHSKAAKVIMLQFKNGKFYFGKSAFTTGPGITPHVTLTDITEAALVAELNAL